MTKRFVDLQRCIAGLACLCMLLSGAVSLAAETTASRDRSPVDLVLSADETWLLTVNQTSDSVSLVRAADGRVLHELPVGRRPAAIALLPDGKRALVSNSYSGTLSLIEVAGEQLKTVGVIQTGFEPTGVVVTRDGQTAYVALAASDQVGVVDFGKPSLVATIDVGRWPRYLALSPDGTRLAVGTSGDRGVTVVDTAARKMLYLEQFLGLNIGHMQASADGQKVYFPWMVYRHNPISVGNIRLGWVLASRIGRVRLDGPARREAFSLDPQGLAIADPFGLALTTDEQRLVVSASGTRELLVYRVADLPFKDYGGTDHIEPDLLKDKERFYRIPLGGRPMGLRIARDSRTVFVTNYLQNEVQVVDLVDRQVKRSIALGSAPEVSLARRGAAVFYDATRSLEQWYSCHTCHYEGGSNSEKIDTMNDGSPFTFKTVLSLHHVHETAPWTWHGWQKDLGEAARTSITQTMQGKEPPTADVDALVEFMKSLELPPNPFRNPDGSLTQAAERGRNLFTSAKAGCANCHSGPHFSDGENHDVGSGGKEDRYKGYNTPSLLGVYRKVRLMHDGRALTLDALLAGPHNPAKVTGKGELTDDERRDLVAYLKSL